MSSNSEQANLFKEIGLGTTGFQSYGTDVASTQTCGGRADYRQDYYYCVKSKNINCQHLVRQITDVTVGIRDFLFNAMKEYWHICNIMQTSNSHFLNA